MRGQAGAGAVRLSARLQAIADMVTPGLRVADVGCDHGFLSIYLVQNGISPKVYAMDVRTGPLSRAAEYVAERKLEAYIETRLSDGLEKLKPEEAEGLVCAGMGGRLMRRILTEGAQTAGAFRELILQPQSELREFRIFLREKGFLIRQEDIVLEDGKFYFVMKAVPGAGSIALPAGSSGQLDEIPQHLADKYGGLLLRGRHPVLREYLLREQETYRKIAANISAQTSAGERAVSRREQVYGELADLQAALKLYGGGTMLW